MIQKAFQILFARPIISFSFKKPGIKWSLRWEKWRYASFSHRNSSIKKNSNQAIISSKDHGPSCGIISPF
jgi:hypothetical protein